MSAVDIVRDILATDTRTAPLIQNRIWPVVQDQNGAMPAVVLSLAGEDDERTLQGHNGYPRADIVCDCLGSSYGEADSLGEALKDALRDYRGMADGRHVDDISLNGIDHFDKGERSDHWRRRIGIVVRYRDGD